MSLSITALSVGRLLGMHTPTRSYLRGWGSVHDAPIIMFVITGGKSPVVVDTGPGGVDWVLEHHGHRIGQTPEQLPAAVLCAMGIDPEDVRLVVNTHLHWDHCSNNDLFPNARIVVQQRELEYALNPVQWQRGSYEHDLGLRAAWRRAEDRIDVIDGDVKLAPDISAVLTPGHSPGSQGVLVEAATQRFLIAGDCVVCYDNWIGDERADHIPSGIYTSLTEYEASFRKIEELECEIIPSHDDAVIERRVFQ